MTESGDSDGASEAVGEAVGGGSAGSVLAWGDGVAPWWVPGGFDVLEDSYGLLRRSPGLGVAEELADLEAARVDDDVLGDGIVAWERLLAWCQARQNVWILEQARRTERIVRRLDGAMAGHVSTPAQTPETTQIAALTQDSAPAQCGVSAQGGGLAQGGVSAQGGGSARGRTVDLSEDRGGALSLLSFTGGACAGELAALLNISSHDARKKIETAEMLDVFLYDTAALLEAGTITASKAAMLAERVKDLDPRIAVTVEDAGLRVGATRPRAAMAKQIEAAIILADPDSANTSAVLARARRRVEAPTPRADGMACLKAIIPADHARLIHTNLTTIARARKTDGDTRTIDQLRADTLLLLATDPRSCQNDPRPTAPPTPPAPVAPGAPAVPAVPAVPGVPGVPVRVADHVHARSCYEVLVTISAQTLAAVLSGEDLSSPPQDLDPPPTTGTRPSATGHGSPTAGHGSPTAGHGSPADGNGSPTAGSPTAGSVPSAPGFGSASGGASQSGTGGAVPETVLTSSSVLPVADRAGGSSRSFLEVPFLKGYGPIAPLLAAMMAANPQSRWRIAITDESGTITSVASRTYKPPADLARIIRGRYRECVFPSCAKPSQDCDLDHTIAFNHANPAQGGQTCPGNLAPLCRTHHNLKTLGLWHLAQPEEGHFEWTSTLGRKYSHDPTPPRINTIHDIFEPAPTTMTTAPATATATVVARQTDTQNPDTHPRNEPANHHGQEPANGPGRESEDHPGNRPEPDTDPDPDYLPPPF